MERRAALFQLGAWNLHIIEGLGEEDVESAAAVYENPVEFDRSDDRVQHEGIAPWVRDSVRVVGPIESYWNFRPSEIFGDGRGNSVDLPSDQLLLPLGLVRLRPPVYHVELMFGNGEHRTISLVAGTPVGPVLVARWAF